MIAGAQLPLSIRGNVAGGAAWSAQLPLSRLRAAETRPPEGGRQAANYLRAHPLMAAARRPTTSDPNPLKKVPCLTKTNKNVFFSGLSKDHPPLALAP